MRRADSAGMSTDDRSAHPRSVLSAAGLAADLERDGTTPRSLWLGYLSLGGTLSFPQLSDTLAGHQAISASDLYLLVKARSSGR